MAIEVKIAPDLDEIKREGNVLECDFNDMHIKWVLAYDGNKITPADEDILKGALQGAIGMSGKLWQVPYILNKHLPFSSEVYVNDKKVDYPKD